jgi:sigma-B regulation protein RsbU (phosphoserine phosphatase)
MFATRNIAYKLILVITTCSVTIFSITIAYFYHNSRSTLERELEANAHNLVLGSVNRVETELTAIGKITEGAARSLETGTYSEKTLNALLKGTLEGNKEIYGFGAAFDPKSSKTGSKPYLPYYCRKNDQISYIPGSSFQFLTQDWYQTPRKSGKKEWSEPYFDPEIQILMTSCSVPFFDGTGDGRRFRGIVVADVSLAWLKQITSSIKVLNSGYSYLLSRNGTVLTHPNKDMVMKETIFSIAESRKIPALHEIGRKMLRGESGFTPYIGARGVKSWLYYAPVSSTGWTLAVVFPEAEMYADVRALTIKVACMGFAGIVLLAVAVALIARSITTPLHDLAEATVVIASGNFDADLPSVQSSDEVGKLTRAFSAMNCALKEYIRNLTETTAAKERIQSELRVATDIQLCLLPRIFPPFPDRPEFDIFASMDPAKEVGGDFYDFFFIDDTNICFLIADVADKGVPAALYMMVAKTLLKSEGQRLGEPDLMLSCVNNILAADNDRCMFATVFCAILNTENGEVRFANAGHNPPLIIESSGVRFLTLKPGMVMGPMADTSYAIERLTLQPGDTLFLYTDGVTESKNSRDDLYGESQLLYDLQHGPREKLADLIHYIRDRVAQHADGAAQSDDVTMLALTYRGVETDGKTPIVSG